MYIMKSGRGIFNIQPKKMQYVDDVTTFIRDSMKEDTRGILQLSLALKNPDIYLTDLTTIEDNIIEGLGAIVEAICRDKTFLDLFGYYTGNAAEDRNSLGGKAFNNDIAILIKKLYNNLIEAINKHVKYDIKTEIIEKMKKVKI